MKKHTHGFAANSSGNFCCNRSLCRFSITTTTSAQPSCPAVTLMRAASSVPAERTSQAGSPLKIVSAVKLRRRFRLQMNKILRRALVDMAIMLTWSV